MPPPYPHSYLWFFFAFINCTAEKMLDSMQRDNIECYTKTGLSHLH